MTCKKSNKHNKETILIKVGLSEHKRKNYSAFYYGAALSFKYFEEEKIRMDDYEKIKEIFNKYSVYLNKGDINLNRELGFFSNKFKLYELKEDCTIRTTKLCNLIINDESSSEYSFGLSYLQLALLQFQIIDNEKEWNPLLNAIKLVKNEQNNLTEILDKLYKWKSYKINEILNRKNFDEIHRLLKFGSGMGKSKKEFQNCRDELTESITNLYLGNISQYLFKKKLIEYTKLMNKFYPRNNKYGGNKFILTLLGISSKEQNEMLYGKNIEFKVDDQKIIDFYYMKSIGDYFFLIKSYVFGNTSLFNVDKTNVEFNEEFAELREFIVDNFDYLYNIENWEEMDLREYYKNIKNNIIRKDVSEFIKNNFNEQLFSKFFESNKNDFVEVFKSTIFDDISKEVSYPTMYEYMVNMFFFIKIYGKRMDDKEFINNEFKNINTLTTWNLLPYSFAPGGRADAIFDYKNHKIIIEPTTQLNNQSKHEFSSVRKHLNHHDAEIALVVAPEIENEFLKDFVEFTCKPYEERNMFGITNNRMIKYINDWESFNWVLKNNELKTVFETKEDLLKMITLFQENLF